MAQIGELIYNIKSYRNSGEHSKDLRLGNRQIEFGINSLRATAATYNKFNSLSLEGFIQSLQVVKITPCDEFISVHRDVRIYKVVDTIPELVTADGYGKLFDFVGTRNGLVRMQKSTPVSFDMDLSLMTIMSVYFTDGNDMFLAIKNYKPITAIFIRGVFANPRDVLKYNKNPDAEGFTWDYPLPQNFVSKITADFMQTEFKYLNVQQPDNTNDGEDI